MKPRTRSKATDKACPEGSRRECPFYINRANARIIQVRHRSYATHSRQPRQVRKEATVTGSCVCSESPVPGLFCFATLFPWLLVVSGLLITKIYTGFTTLFARIGFSRINGVGRQITRPRKERNEESLCFPHACSPRHHSRIRKIVSGTSGVFGSAGPVCGGVSIVATAGSAAPGGVGPGRAYLSAGRRE